MLTGGVLAYLPSPPSNGVSVGPLRLHLYGLMIAVGVVAAVWFAQRRFEARGGRRGTMSLLALWVVPAGLVGARLYSVVTSWGADVGNRWYRAFEIWQGGLGIWGGVAFGLPAGVYACRRYQIDWRAALDSAAPALILAQAIGRWGNYFNQELYGSPSRLPWAVKIAHPVHCTSVTHCTPYPPTVTTFQPTFLYESIWDLACVGMLLWIERHWPIRKGYLFFAYAALYTIGRGMVEHVRIDEAHQYFGLRLNDWVSIAVFVGSVAILLTRGRARPGEPTVLSPVEHPPRTRTDEQARAGAANVVDTRPRDQLPAKPQPARGHPPP
jgi:phosphatidylglycerol---prolipoprotein diacylglyceryl transferase